MIETYNLPDAEMFQEKGPSFEIRSWQPDRELIVLGNSDKIDTSVFLEKVTADNISIMKRPTGGHAVFLSPKMFSVSMVWREKPLPGSKDFFAHGNEIIMKALQELGVKDLSLEGISDIAVKNKKIVGTAIYRNSHLVFYQAILNLGEKPKRIGKYLKYPRKTPDYRNDRPHSEFVTSLWQEGYLLEISEIRKQIN